MLISIPEQSNHAQTLLSGGTFRFEEANHEKPSCWCVLFPGGVARCQGLIDN